MIGTGDNIVASDFVGSSSGASDSGKAAKLDALGQFLRAFIKNPLRSSGSASKNLADSNGATQTIAHGLGVAPTKIRIKAVAAPTAAVSWWTDGTWITGGIYAVIGFYFFEGGSTAAADTADQDTSYICKLYKDHASAADLYQTATVTVDGTNITLTWAKNGAPTGTVTFLWEAEAYS